MMWEASEKDLFAGAAPKRPAGRDVTGELTVDDLDQDRTLRPRTLDEYIGQERVRENLRVLIQAARDRGETLDHVIFSGPPGLGKTTLAGIVANEMGAKMHTTSGPAIERAGDLAAILTNLEEGDVLFVDEIHRLNHQIEEILSSSWTSSSARARRRAPSASTCRTSPSWAPPRAPAFSPAPCATALASRIALTTTRPPSSPSS